MPEPGGDTAIAQWDRYWSFGSLHSFSQVAGGNYAGAIADFWRRQFATLEVGARVVDIATGNGAVPLLALEAADAAGIEIGIDGVDLASIDPARRVGDAGLREALARIRFHPRTPAESLPFDDASVSLVCSQYGLEYSDLPAAVREIGRVSTPDARLALVVHHEASVLLRATALELEQLAFVLDEARLWVHARNLLRAMAEAGGKGRPKVEKKRRSVDAALERIRQEAERSANPRMLLGPTNYVHEILALVGRESWPRLLELLEESRQRLLANRQRLLDMQNAACNAGDIEHLQRLLDEQGFAVDVAEPLHEGDGALLGWQLSAHRDDANRSSPDPADSIA